MFKELKEDIFIFKLFALIVSIVGGIYILQLAWGIIGHFSDVFLILILAWLLSFVLEPPVVKLVNFGLSRNASAVTLYVLLTALIVFFVIMLLPIISFQITTISDNLPSYLSALSLSQGIMLRVQEAIGSLLSNSLVLASSVASFLFSTFIVLLLSFYFLIDREKIQSGIERFIPTHYRDEVHFISWAVSTSFATFIRVQAVFGLISGILTWLVLWVFGVEFAISAGVLGGVFTLIPVVGPALALFPAFLAAISHGTEITLLILLVLGILQFMEFNIIGPKIWGSAMRLHPAIVFLSFLLGYKLAGGWGSVFALPVVAVFFIITEPLINHFFQRKSTE